MKHLSESELAALADRALDPRRLAEAERHLTGCDECRAAFAAVLDQDRTLRAALEHDPGEAYFDRFADRVRERIERSESRAPLAASLVRPGDGRSWLDRLTGPRLAWISAAAALVVAVGVVFMVARETPTEKIGDARIVARTQQVAPGAPSSGTREREAGPAAGAAPEARGRQAPAAPPQPFAAAPGTRTAQAPADRKETAVARDEAAPTPAAQAPTAGAPRSNSAPPAASGGALTKQEATTGNLREVHRVGDEEVAVPKRTEGFAPPPSAPESQAMKTRIVKPSATPLAQSHSYNEVASRVCGTVRDAGGRAVVGAVVSLVDLGRTAVSDAHGHYCIDAPAGARTLSVNALGFHEWRGTVTVGAAGDQDVALTTVNVLGTAGGFAQSPGYSWPASARAQVASAESVSAAAERLRSATAFDSAAVLWERLALAARPGSAATGAARHAAEARYRAWQIAPNPARAASASAMLTRYGSLPGSDHAWAQERLDQLAR